MTIFVIVFNRSPSTLIMRRLAEGGPGDSGGEIAPGASRRFINISGNWEIVENPNDVESQAQFDLGRDAILTITDLQSRELPWHGPGPKPAWANHRLGGTMHPVAQGQEVGTFYFRYDGTQGIRLEVGDNYRVSAWTLSGQIGGQVLGSHDSPGSRIDVHLESAGAEDGYTAKLNLNGRSLYTLGLPGQPSNPGRGLNVAVVNETTGEVLHVRVFDTYVSHAQSEEFVNFIRSLPIGRFVLIAVMDEAWWHLTERGKLVCEQLGSRYIRNLGYRDSWCLMGQVGASPGSIVEGYQRKATGSTSISVSEMPLQPLISNGIAIIAQSAGRSVGNQASLVVAGDAISAMPDEHGLNVAVISPEGAVSQGRNFDANASSDAVAAFVEWVNDLQYGTCVAAAVKGDASLLLTDPARKALRSLGARLAEFIGDGHSYALVGFKGASEGSAAEQRSSTSPCFAHYHLMPETVNGVAAINGESDGFSISLSSAGKLFGNDARIAVDGVPVGTVGHGVNVAVIDPSTGIVSQTQNFDTNANREAGDAFASLVEELPTGQLVVLAVMYDGSVSATERFRHAAAAVGSRLVTELGNGDSWALLGRKGAAPGCVPEQISSRGAIGLEMWFTLDGPRLHNQFRDIVVDSAGADVKGASTAITVDGIKLGLKGRGLHVALFDEQNADVLHMQVFDTHASSTAADDFAALIESQPVGRVMAVGVYDTAILHLSDRAKGALASVGGSEGIKMLSDGQSWAFIGRKGAVDESSASAIVTNGSADFIRSAPARAAYRLFPKRKFSGVHGFNVSLRSGGLGTGNAMVAVKDKIVDIPNTRGLNVVVLNTEEGSVISTHVFDTFIDPAASERFAELVESLERYTLVAVTVFDEASNKLSERARRALRSLGSLLVDNISYGSSWVLFGTVGFAPGGSFEVQLDRGPVAASVWVPYGNVQRQSHVLFLPILGLLGAAVVGVAANIFIGSKCIPEERETVISAPPRVIPNIEGHKRRALLVVARTPSLGRPELPKRADKTMALHRRMLVSAGLFVESDITLISRLEGTEATKERVLSELRKLGKGAVAGDVLLFAFLGHGTIDSRSSAERHCVKVWKDDARSKQALLYDDEIASSLSTLHPDVNITCILHACYSGGLVDEVPALTSRANRGIAITATDRANPSALDNGLIQALSEQHRIYGIDRHSDPDQKIASYNKMFESVKSYIKNHHSHTGESPWNPQMVDMTGNDGGNRQNLDTLGYLNRFI